LSGMVFIHIFVASCTTFLCAVDTCEQVCYIDYDINLGLVYFEVDISVAGEG